MTRGPLLQVAMRPSRGDFIPLSPFTVADATCRLCRRPVRRWLMRGDVIRAEGELAMWRADADAAGDSTLQCPLCLGIFILTPVRTIGGAVQYYKTALSAASTALRVGFIVACLFAGLVVIAQAAGAQTSPSPTVSSSEPVPSPSPSPAGPCGATSDPCAVRVEDVSGGALQLLTVIAGLSLATASAALISGWSRR